MTTIPCESGANLRNWTTISCESGANRRNENATRPYVLNGFTTKMCDSSTFLQHRYPGKLRKSTAIPCESGANLRKSTTIPYESGANLRKSTTIPCESGAKLQNENARSPYVFNGSKNEKTRSPYVFNGFQPKMTISLRSGAVFEPKDNERTRHARTRRRLCKSRGNPSNRNLICLALTHSFASHARTKRNDFPVDSPPNLRYLTVSCWDDSS